MIARSVSCFLAFLSIITILAAGPYPHSTLFATMSAEGQCTKTPCEVGNEDSRHARIKTAERSPSLPQKMPAWNSRPTDKETDKHLTTVESNLRLLSEVKDRARKYGVSYMTASPYPRWILASLYEMRLTVALLDANGEGALSYFQRHTLTLARMAVRELEEMKREVEVNSGAAVDVWGTMDGRDERAGLAQEAEVSKDKKPPHGSASSASAQAPVAVVEEEHDYAKIKREDQTAAKDRIDGSSKVDGQAQRSPNVKQEGAGSRKTSKDDKRGVEPKTVN